MNPFDFFDVRGLLTDEEQVVQDSVGRFVNERVLPIIGECRKRNASRELVAELAALGVLGCSMEGFGGAGLNSVCYGLVCQELERGDSGLRSFVSVQNSLCMYPIHRYGSEDQKQFWLPQMAAGKAIGCFGLTEPDGGSDPGTMKTHARRGERIGFFRAPKCGSPTARSPMSPWSGR